MALARYVIGVLLTATGLFFGLGALSYVAQPDPEIPMWGDSSLFSVERRF